MRPDSRQALLEAVGGELADVGIGGISLRSVARRAGYSHGAPGALFGDRAGMLTAFATSGFDVLTARLRVAAQAHDEPRAALAAVGSAYVGFALDEPATFELMFRADLLDARDVTFERARTAAWTELSDVIERGVQRGLIAPALADTTRIGAWSIAHGLAVLALGRHASRRSEADDLSILVAAVTAQFAQCVFGGAHATS